MTKLELEHLGQKLQRDYRNLKTQVLAADPDAHTLAFLSSLGRTVLEVKKVLQDTAKEIK